MFQDAGCSDTVSILRAIVHGADGACIDLGMASLLPAIGVFILSVVVVSLVGGKILRAMWAKAFGKKAQLREPAENDYESPIKSTGAWGRKFR